MYAVYTVYLLLIHETCHLISQLIIINHIYPNVLNVNMSSSGHSMEQGNSTTYSSNVIDGLRTGCGGGLWFCN